MVTIKKGNKERKVPLSAYNEFYKSIGWVVVGNKESEKVKVENKNVKDENVDLEEDINVNLDEENTEEDWDNIDDSMDYEKPLANMNHSELVEKASMLNIDISDCSTNKQIRERIKKNS